MMNTRTEVSHEMPASKKALLKSAFFSPGFLRLPPHRGLTNRDQRTNYLTTCRRRLVDLSRKNERVHMQTLRKYRDFQIGCRLAAMMIGAALVLILAWPQAAASAPNAWSPTGPLGTARYSHTATRLADGRVLAAGGFNTMYTASAELYNPNSGTWTATGPLGTARHLHKDALLADGRVLVVGGSGAIAFMPNADIFDPAAEGGVGAWTATAPLTTGRSYHTATGLLDGRVLVVGGIKNGSTTGYLNSAQIFDPAANSGLGGWTDTASMVKARKDHTATLLPDGRVLVAGGFNMTDFTMKYAEIFDPAANSGHGGWTDTGSMGTGRYSHTATLLADGRVLVAGNAGYNTSTEIFDPAANSGVGTWSPTGPLGTGRYLHTATRLTDGQVLVAGGYGPGSAYLTSSELYDPVTAAWTATGALSNGRTQHTATLLTNGRVLAAGGQVGGTAMTSAELFTPVQGNITFLFLLLGD
jgi:hypothetical protein